MIRLLLVLCLAPAVAFAETDKERQAREDLEAQLKSMVGTPPTKVLIEYVGLDQPNYELLEATFTLDGRELPHPDLLTLDKEGDHLIFHGDVAPGPHRVEASLHFNNKTSQIVSNEGGFKWKKGWSGSFKSERGIEVQVKITPDLDFKADLKNRIKITGPTTVKMLAVLDDGRMPDPLARPVAAPDAGAVVVKGQTAAELAVAAAEAKKKEREEALAVKQAAEEAKRQAEEEAKAARAAAAEEKKRAAEEAKAARIAAAEGKQRPPAEGTRTVPAIAVVDAGPAEVAAVEVDAGLVALVPPPTPPPERVEPKPAPPEESSGFPVVAILLAVAALGVILFLIARKRAQPPSI